MFTLGPALRSGDAPFKFRIVASTGSGFSPHYDIFAVGQTIWWGGSFDLNFRPAVISTPLVTGVIPGPSNFAVANSAIGSNSFTYIYDGTHLWGVSSSLGTIRKFNPNTLAQSEFSKSNGGYVIVSPTGDVWVKRSSTVFGKLDKTAPAGADLVTRTFSSSSQSAILTGGANDYLVVAVSGGIVRRIGTAGTEASVTLPGAGAYTPTLAWDTYRERLFALIEGMKTAWDIEIGSMTIANTITWSGLATADRARHVYDPLSGYLWMARFFGTGRHFDVAAVRASDGVLMHNKRVSSGVLGGTSLGGNNELREIMVGPGRSLYAVSPYSTGSSLALVGAVKLPGVAVGPLTATVSYSVYVGLRDINGSGPGLDYVEIWTDTTTTYFMPDATQLRVAKMFSGTGNNFTPGTPVISNETAVLSGDFSSSLTNDEIIQQVTVGGDSGAYFNDAAVPTALSHIIALVAGSAKVYRINAVISSPVSINNNAIPAASEDNTQGTITFAYEMSEVSLAPVTTFLNDTFTAADGPLEGHTPNATDLASWGWKRRSYPGSVLISGNKAMPGPDTALWDFLYFDPTLPGTVDSGFAGGEYSYRLLSGDNYALQLPYEVAATLHVGTGDPAGTDNFAQISALDVGLSLIRVAGTGVLELRVTIGGYCAPDAVGATYTMATDTISARAVVYADHIDVFNGVTLLGSISAAGGAFIGAVLRVIRANCQIGVSHTGSYIDDVVVQSLP